LRFPPGNAPGRSPVVFRFGWHLCRLIIKTYFRGRWEGWENVPETGPFILAVNHQSFMDPPLVGVGLPRPISTLARESLFRNPVLGWLFRSVGAVPVDRDGASGKGLKTIIDRLMSGDGIILFPEGTRTTDGSIGSGRSGIGLIVLKSKAPVIPSRLFGSYEAWGRQYKFPRPRPVAVRYGAPMFFEAERAEAATASRPRVKELYQEVTDKIMAAIGRIERP